MPEGNPNGKLAILGAIVFLKLNKELEKSWDADRPRDDRADLMDKFFGGLTAEEIVMCQMGLGCLQDALQYFIPYVRSQGFMRGSAIMNLPELTQEQIGENVALFRKKLETENA